MADLLGSILGSMAKPPVNQKEQEQKRKERELAKKMEEKQRQETKKFRESVEKRINEFLQKETERKLAFEPMDKFHRSLVHDVAEIAGLISYSFGEEDVDRALTVWKKEYQPCEDELECLR